MCILKPPSTSYCRWLATGPTVSLAKVAQSSWKTVTEADANDRGFIKSLLENRTRESAISLLSMMIHKVRGDDEVVTNMYMKVLPVFCAHGETKNVNGGTQTSNDEMVAVIQLMLQNPAFQKFKNLLTRWHTRLINSSKSAYFKIEDRKWTRFSVAEMDLATNIGYEDLDFFIAICKWLRYHKLHKYIYFFANISYQQFIQLDITSSYDLDTAMDLLPMTKGGRDTILRKMDDLRARTKVLNTYIQEGYFADDKKVGMALWKLKEMLHTPVKSCSTVRNNDFDQIPELLETAITKATSAVLKYPTVVDNIDVLQRVLKASWSCSFFSKSQKSKFNQQLKDVQNCSVNCTQQQNRVHIAGPSEASSLTEATALPSTEDVRIIKYSPTHWVLPPADTVPIMVHPPTPQVLPSVENVPVTVHSSIPQLLPSAENVQITSHQETNQNQMTEDERILEDQFLNLINNLIGLMDD